MESVIDNVINALFGNFTNRTRTLLKRYGNNYINKIEIKRQPIERAVNTLLNIITLGQWEKAKAQANYDKLFHLSMLIHLDNGKVLILEKNQNINLQEYQPAIYGPQTETRNVILNRRLTLFSLMDNTLKRVGKERFFKYDAFRLNCQVFITDVLLSNGMLNEDLKKFILQPVDILLQKLPNYTSKLSRMATNVASYFEKFYQSFRRYKKGGVVNKQIIMKKTPERRTRDYRLKGGVVNAEDTTAYEQMNDSIPALLQYGEVVIPRKHAKLVIDFLKSKNIFLPGMQK